MRVKKLMLYLWCKSSRHLVIDANNEEINHNIVKESSHHKQLSESMDEHDSASEANLRHKKPRNGNTSTLGYISVISCRVFFYLSSFSEVEAPSKKINEEV